MVGFYGRRISAKLRARAPLPARSSPGPCQPRRRRKAYREELVLTESVIDALSLIALGIQNVIPCYGVNGFTEEHAKLLHDERVKTVVIGFDSDEAGREGAEQLCRAPGELKASRVKLIAPPTGKDWNEALVAGLTQRAGPGAARQARRCGSRSSRAPPPSRSRARDRATSSRAPRCATASWAFAPPSSPRFG